MVPKLASRSDLRHKLRFGLRFRMRHGLITMAEWQRLVRIPSAYFESKAICQLRYSDNNDKNVRINSEVQFIFAFTPLASDLGTVPPLSNQICTSVFSNIDTENYSLGVRERHLTALTWSNLSVRYYGSRIQPTLLITQCPRKIS